MESESPEREVNSLQIMNQDHQTQQVSDSKVFKTNISFVYTKNAFRSNGKIWIGVQCTKYQRVL